MMMMMISARKVETKLFFNLHNTLGIAPIVFHLDEVDISDIVWSIGSMGTIGVQRNKCDKI